jgi:hypothetical protein
MTMLFASVASGSAFSPLRQMWILVLSATVSAARTEFMIRLTLDGARPLANRLPRHATNSASVISETGLENSSVSVR